MLSIGCSAFSINFIAGLIGPHDVATVKVHVVKVIVYSTGRGRLYGYAFSEPPVVAACKVPRQIQSFETLDRRLSRL